MDVDMLKRHARLSLQSYQRSRTRELKQCFVILTSPTKHLHPATVPYQSLAGYQQPFECSLSNSKTTLRIGHLGLELLSLKYADISARNRKEKENGFCLHFFSRRSATACNYNFETRQLTKLERLWRHATGMDEENKIGEGRLMIVGHFQTPLRLGRRWASRRERKESHQMQQDFRPLSEQKEGWLALSHKQLENQFD